jgi:DNA-binding beta-propeller fold protein YncE
MSLERADGSAEEQTPTAAQEPGQDNKQSTGRSTADLVIPSLFLSVAALLLALIDPIYVHFQPHPIPTLSIIFIGAALLWLGTLTRRMQILYIGAAVLLATITVQAITQPTFLSVPVTAVWPLRILLVMLVGCSWAFLMRPPRWLSRAILGFAVPTVLILALWGGPATASSLFGWNIYVPNLNFPPYWLAVDSHDTVYATDANGNLIWVFDSSGTPLGTIRPSRAPQVPTPGPGILPNGMEEELNLAKVSLLPTAIANPSITPAPIIFDFCGLAVDPEDSLYTVDNIDPTGPKLLRFDRNGIITARWGLPKDFSPTRGCVAVDDDHIYLGSRFGDLYTMDREANVQRDIKFSYQPLGLALTGKGDLLVTGPTVLNRIKIDSGEVFTTTLPPPPEQVRIPYQSILVTRDGEEALVTDMWSNKILRIDLEKNEIVGEFGGAGFNPGQFQALGGITQDKQGRIYVADWQHRVIQRFTPDGDIDALLWAALSWPENQAPQGEID